MTTSPGTDHSQRWLWGTCLVALLVGIGVGRQHLGTVPSAPFRTEPIPASLADHLTLTHPFPARPDPAKLPGELLYSLYPTDPKIETSLAEQVRPMGFGLSDRWVTELLDSKLPNVSHTFAFRMRGQIRFTQPVNHLHVRSDNGYRILFRDTQGNESHMDDWTNSVTEDFYFQVTAEPGCYEVEIDYCNFHGNAYFDMWSEGKDIVFYPAGFTPAPTAPPPTK